MWKRAFRGRVLRTATGEGHPRIPTSHGTHGCVSDAQRRSAARDTADGGCPVAERFAMHAASARPFRDAVLRRCPETVLGRATLRVTYKLTLPLRVPTKGGDLPQRSVSSHTRGLHCRPMTLSWNACFAHDATKMCGGWNARGHTSAAEVSWRTAPCTTVK